MSNHNRTDLEKTLTTAFDSGYCNASASLSLMAGNKINHSNFHTGVHAFGKDDRLSLPFDHNNRKFLVTTEVFGDVTGMSYLFLNETEFNILTSKVPESKNPEVNFKHEFLKEVDNIISASVITHLANELNLKLYGDIPLLRENDRPMEGMIHDDFGDLAEDLYVNSISFSFENEPQINPLFIWVMDGKIIGKIADQ